MYYFLTIKVTTISVWSLSRSSSNVIVLSTSWYSSIKEPYSLNLLTSLLFGRTTTSPALWYVSTNSPFFIIIFNLFANVKLNIKSNQNCWWRDYQSWWKIHSIRINFNSWNEWGIVAKEYVKKICPVGSTVLVDEDDQQTEVSMEKWLSW